MHFRGGKWLVALALALGISLWPAVARAQTTPGTGAGAQPMDCVDCEVDEDDAAFVDQSVPASLQTGQTATVTIRMQNTGNTTWRSSSGYNLVPVSPQIGTAWGVSQIASGTVYANQTAAFSFTITAPPTEGTYNFQWQMLHNGSWFGVPTVNVAIQVAPPVDPPPELPPSPNFSRTETITYWDNTTKWVLGQTASVTCTASIPASTSCYTGTPPTGALSNVISQTTFDATYALPGTYSSFGKPQQTLTYNTTSTVASGQLGTLKTVKDGNNNVTTLSNWKRGIPQTIKYPATPEAPTGATETAVVNDNGWITSVTDENGFATGYGYDAMGRLASIAYPTGDTTTWNTATQVFEPVAASEYGIAAGHWRQTITTGNGKKITYFDALWRPVVVREYDAANVAGTQRFQRFDYDHEGRVTFASYPGTTDALSTGTWTDYDALGRVTSVSQDSEQGLLTTTTAYQTGFQTLVTDPKGNATTTKYMAYDQPSTDWPVNIYHPEGAITDIGRDAFGKPSTITRRNGDSSVWQRRYFYYDANQQLCKSKETETGITAYGYDGAGNLTWSAAGLPWSSDATCEYTAATAAARRVDRTYDARNRLKTLNFPDGLGNQTWTYTPDGLPAAITTYNATGNTTPVDNTYSYNRRRLMTQETMARNGGTPWYIGYAYNANGHLSRLDYPSSLYVDYAPNALGQATTAGAYATGISYYPNGAIKQFTYGNGIVHTLTQNARQLPSRSTDVATLDLGYSYDENANVSQITDYVNGRQTRGMAYDGLDRLTQATSNMWGTASYTYDVLDNLTRATVGTSPTMAARDHFYCYSSNRLTNVKTGSCSGTTVIGLGYDVQGNLANKSGQAYSFDFGNRLRVVTGKESYLYDGHGRRVQATTGSAAYVISHYSQSGQLLYQQDYRKAQREEYVYLGGSLVANLETPHASGSATVVKYQHTDALGSPIATTGANKAVLETTEYEPYGRQSNRAITDGPGFTGHVQDAATGLTYMQQRYYDPLLGRFLSVDPVTVRPIGDNFNRYWYANNNPYTNTDPDGRECNGKGCWVTPAEREAAASGNWRGYYQQAGSAGDSYAQRAGEVASNTGSTPLNETLSNITNKILSDSIATNMGADPQNLSTGQQVAIEFKMEGIRVGLAQAHVQALDDAGASPSNPVSLDRAVIGEFHREVFKANGADPSVFGGFKVDAAEKVINVFGGTTRDIYDYCPKPSCSN